MREQITRFDAVWLIVPIAILVYAIPWVFNPTITLSPGAYDIAEFLAKRPFDDQGYLTVMALRGQLVFFTWLFAISITRPAFTMTWWVHLLACLVLIVSQLPPLTFTTNTGDVNQQQQAILAGISALGVLAGLTGILYNYRFILRLIIAIAGLVTTIYAIINVVELMQSFQLATQIGVGGIGLAIVYLILAGVSLLQWGKK